MITLFLKTFLMVLLVEIGSTSQFAIAGIAAHSGRPMIVWTASIIALGLSCFVAVLAGKWLETLPVSPNLISGGIMILIGLFLLWKH